MTQETEDKKDAIVSWYLENQRQEFTSLADMWLRRCESPIETLMGLALVACSRHEIGAINFMGRMTYEEVLELSSAKKPEYDQRYNLFNQIVIGPYRTDFIIAFRFDNAAAMAVIECDGHDFHEKTQDQAVRDKARDRYLQSKGLLVLRYSGREIWRDAIGCAKNAMDTVMSRCYAESEKLWQVENSLKVVDHG